jgi:hypothetical protein
MTNRIVLALGCLLSFAAPAAAQDMASAESFLRTLYAGYAPGKKPPASFGKDVDRLFAPALAGLIRADSALAMGEVGTLDSDPICACQDWDKLKVTKIDLMPDGPKRARATVSFDNAGGKTTVRYWLEAVDGKWRIADISERSMESLRQMLATAIAGRAKELAQ